MRKNSRHGRNILKKSYPWKVKKITEVRQGEKVSARWEGITETAVISEDI